MNNTDDQTTIQELKDLVAAFGDERGWGKHYTPKNLAISIAIEAAELMEHFQWDNYRKEDKEAIAAELADVLSYCLNFAHRMDIDIATTFRAKLEAAKKKYPTETFNPENDGAEEYFRIKKAYREHK